LTAETDEAHRSAGPRGGLIRRFIMPSPERLLDWDAWQASDSLILFEVVKDLVHIGLSPLWFEGRCTGLAVWTLLSACMQLRLVII
jgi:hypothetical protein